MSIGPADAPTMPFRHTLADSERGGRGWALAFSVSLVLIVCIRFFSEDMGLLPGAVQYVDVPITLALIFCSFLSFIRRGHRVGRSKLGIAVFLFLLVSLGSAAVNMSRTAPLPTAMFLFNYLCPLVIALVVIDAPLVRRDVESVGRTFFWLGILQVAVSLFYSLPRFFATNNPDFVSGTFGRNAYQFTYFIGLWLLYVIGGTMVRDRQKRRWGTPAIILAALLVFGLFYAAQYRAMLIFYTVAILLTLWAAPTRLSKRLGQILAVTGASIIMLVIVATAFPSLKLLGVFDLLKDTSPVIQSGKVQAVENVGTMYGDMPHTLLVGSGPATFGSRSYKVFADQPEAKEAAGSIAVGLMGGRYITDVASRYLYTIRTKPIQGGTTASSPWSSFTSLAAEVGVLGLLTYLWVYAMALVYARRRLAAAAKTGDRLGARLAFTCFGGLLLLLFQAVFDNWFEVTRVTIPLWMLVGLLYAHERISRSSAAPVSQGASPDPSASLERWP